MQLKNNFEMEGWGGGAGGGGGGSWMDLVSQPR